MDGGRHPPGEYASWVTGAAPSDTGVDLGGGFTGVNVSGPKNLPARAVVCSPGDGFRAEGDDTYAALRYRSRRSAHVRGRGNSALARLRVLAAGTLPIRSSRRELRRKRTQGNPVWCQCAYASMR
jgi:hypothetical protein